MADEVSEVLTPDSVVKKIKPKRVEVIYDLTGASCNEILFRNREIIYFDDVEVSREDTTHTHKDCESYGDHTVTITDPETAAEITISLSGIFEAIKQMHYDIWTE